MKVYFEKKPEGLFPIHESDVDNLSRIKNGSVFMKDFKLVRNPDFHRLVFNLLNEVFRFQDKFDDFEKFRKRIKLLIGDVEESFIEEKDGVVKIGLEYISWEFGKMDEIEFRERFKRIKTACCHHFCFTEEQFNLINNYD